MGARGKQPQPNNLPELNGRSKVRKVLDTTSDWGAIAPSADPGRYQLFPSFYRLAQKQTFFSARLVLSRSRAESCESSVTPDSGFQPWMRSACRAQSTLAQRTQALPPKFAARLSGFRTPPPRQAWVPFRKTSSVALGVGRAGTPSGQACTAPSGKSLNTGATECTIAHFSSVA